MTCFLCQSILSNHPIIEEEQSFCCHGCHAVYRILSAKNALNNFQEHPVFKQAIRSGLISNPDLLSKMRASQIPLPENEWEKLYFSIEDLWCPSCAEVIKLVLLQEKGIRNCTVDYATDLCSIEYAPRYQSKKLIWDLISSLGYTPQSLEEEAAKSAKESLHLRFVVAAFFSLNIMMFAYPIYASFFDFEPWGYAHLFSYLSLAASLPVLFYSGWPIFSRCWIAFKIGHYGMELLVFLGVFAAFALSVYQLYLGTDQVYFDSMTVIITFMLFGKIIETRAKFSAKESLKVLYRSVPKRGRKRFLNGSEQFVSLKEVQFQDELVVFAGERIPLDGIVVEGEGYCDESLMTGEAIPVHKKVNSIVMGGTILQQGMVVYRVLSSLDQSMLHRILEMVEGDIAHKSMYVRAADRVVQWFVPCVVAISFGAALYLWLAGFGIETAVVRAVAILLISCPCAIGIAAPLVESQLLHGLAAMGVIVRNRGVLRLLGKEDVFVFDKTGTVTEGNFKLRSGLESLSKIELRALKGLSSRSLHPIASAIAKSIEELPSSFSKIEEFPGLGLKGMIDEKLYLLGSSRLLESYQIEVLQGLNSSVDTQVYFAENGRLLTQLSLGDRIREEARELIPQLKPIQTLLLSGDRKEAVEAVGQTCGFDAWKFSCNPLEKREVIRNLRDQGLVVAMLGDGINDAPALTEASIGISVVNATDISIQVSDLLLTTDNLKVIPKMRTLASKGQRIIKQNLFWAFFYNVIGIGLAVFGLLSPIFAAFAMVASSLMVVVNARRVKDL